MIPLLLLALADAPADFGATCRVTVGESHWSAPCRSTDVGGRGYNNRWRVVLAHAPREVVGMALADYVRTQATARGYTISTPLLGIIEIRAHAVAFTAGAFETRPQRVTVTRLPDGAVEIEISEPCEDFTGRTISPRWLADHADSFARYGAAR